MKEPEQKQTIDPVHKKTIDPVVDQKIIKEKRHSWLWWLLAALIILLLIFWLMHRPHRTATPPATEPAQTQQPADTNTNPPATTPDNGNTSATTSDNTPAATGNNNDNTSAATPDTGNDDTSAAAGNYNDNTAMTDNNNVTSNDNGTTPAALSQVNNYFSNNPTADSQWIALDGVNFASGSATPAADSDDQLKQIADVLKDHKDSSVIVHGYTDATGNQELNKQLSTDRAEAVRQWFIKHGIDSQRVKVEGQGASKPVASNDTAEGRDMNRRVAIKIVPEGASQGE